MTTNRLLGFQCFPDKAVLLLAATVVYNAERLNTLLAKHWQSFASQPYFESRGIFINAVISAPLLLAMFIALVRQ